MASINSIYTINYWAYTYQCPKSNFTMVPNKYISSEYFI